MLIQEDGFAFIQIKNVPKSYVVNSSDNLKFKKPNLLLLGMDTLSRMNFRRTMPNVFEYLQRNHWFELQGYNKVSKKYSNKFSTLK